MTAEINFKVGDKFKNVDDVKSFIKNYNKKNFTCFIIATNNQRQLQVKCKHGLDRPSKSTGKRTAIRNGFIILFANHWEWFHHLISCLIFHPLGTLLCFDSEHPDL